MDKIFSHNVSIVLDNRRKKTNGKFPVKLRVYSKAISNAKLYSIGIDLTDKEFQSIWINGNSNAVRAKNKEIRIRLQKFETRANDEVEKLNPFTFEKFERRFFRKSSDANNLLYHYEKAISENIGKGRISSSESFKCSLKSLITFNKYYKGKETESFPFRAITVDWLEAYETFMLDEGKSITTVGIYLRALRIIFNNAIDSNDIGKELYPFGKRKYQIPQSKTVKKALNNEQLKILYASNPKTIEQEKAKDFWFFSYACNGINLKDVALLRYSDIIGDKFSYYRAKTFQKSKTKAKIEVYITQYPNTIIEKYGLKDKDGFVFPILSIEQSELEKHNRIKNFTRFISQHIKQIAKDNGLPEDISYYWARHSFATNAIRKGASMEFISEALNHSDLSVTKNYFAGFEDKTKKEFANQIMDF